MLLTSFSGIFLQVMKARRDMKLLHAYCIPK